MSWLAKNHIEVDCSNRFIALHNHVFFDFDNIYFDCSVVRAWLFTDSI